MPTTKSNVWHSRTEYIRVCQSYVILCKICSKSYLHPFKSPLFQWYIFLIFLKYLEPQKWATVEGYGIQHFLHIGTPQNTFYLYICTIHHIVVLEESREVSKKVKYISLECKMAVRMQSKRENTMMVPISQERVVI